MSTVKPIFLFNILLGSSIPNDHSALARPIVTTFASLTQSSSSQCWVLLVVKRIFSSCVDIDVYA